MCLDGSGFFIGRSLRLGFAEFGHQCSGTSFETTLETTSNTGMDKLCQLSRVIRDWPMINWINGDTSSEDLSRRSSRSTPLYEYLRNWRFFLSSAACRASASSAMFAINGAATRGIRGDEDADEVVVVLVVVDVRASKNEL